MSKEGFLIRFFYWADQHSESLRPLLDSADANSIRPEPIGLTERRLRNIHHSLFKQQALFDAVKGLDRDEIVCATDGFDVFFQQGPTVVMDTFLSFGCDVVFSAERGYSHQYLRFKRFFDEEGGESPYRYLNAGGVIGYAWALEKLYRPGLGLKARVAITRMPGVTRTLILIKRAAHKLRLLPADLANDLVWLSYTDQTVMGKYAACGRKGLSIELDRSCRLFWCAAFEWDDIDDHYTITAGKCQNRHTGQIPALIHVPWWRKRAVFKHLYEVVYGSDEPMAEASRARPDGQRLMSAPEPGQARG